MSSKGAIRLTGGEPHSRVTQPTALVRILLLMAWPWLIEAVGAAEGVAEVAIGMG